MRILKCAAAVLAIIAFAVGNPSKVYADTEMHGVWISYNEWKKMPTDDEKKFEAYVDDMMDKCTEIGMNTVFVHVRADADAMYPSEYFPWSAFVTGTQGEDPGYDPFEYMVEAAHKKDLKIHAWINPYRVTHKDNTWDSVCNTNPAYVWLSDSSPANDRWVLVHDEYAYFNPAIDEVRTLIVNGVKEIVENYDVDGVHMDDYFYPTVDDSDSTRWFDKPEYDASGSKLSIADWRRENVNILLKDIYSSIKSINPKVSFGVSPAGNLDNLRSNSRYFTDIDTWMGKPGYVDYVMPQLYWGFEAKDKEGKTASYAYENNLKRWTQIKRKQTVRLYLGLPMFQAGSDIADNNEKSEWLENDDIIARMVEKGRKTGEVSGYVFYSYSSFDGAAAKKEVNNLKKVLDD